jgi:peptidoglycan/LPS O-acetylase OafA/YrhL
VKSRNLDLLRAIAVLCVFVAHLLGSTGVWKIGSLGRFGVIIFFVHTSLVLMFSLERLQHDGFGNGWRLAAAFWMRRAFRIYPLSSVFIVLAVIAGIPQELGDPYVWLGMPVLISNLALAQNLFYHSDVLGILWSLPLEVQMYALLPFAFLLLNRRWKYGAAALWVLAVVLALTMPRISPRLSVFTYAPCFTAGIVAFAVARTSERRIPGWCWLPSVLLLILLFGPFDNVRLADKMGRAWVLTLALGVLAAHTREHTWDRLNAVAHWIAEQSYGIYLSHIPVLWLVIYVMADWPFVVRAIVLIVASVGVPAVCYRYIEKPLIRYGATVAQRVRPIEPVITAEQAVI